MVPGLSEPWATVRAVTDFSRPPTEQQIIDAFTDYAAARAEANVAIAKAVAKVAFAGGR